MHSQPSADQARIFWQSDLARRYGHAATTIWRWKLAGKLPPPDVAIAGKIGWYQATIEAHERAGASAHQGTP